MYKNQDIMISMGIVLMDDLTDDMFNIMGTDVDIVDYLSDDKLEDMVDDMVDDMADDMADYMEDNMASTMKYDVKVKLILKYLFSDLDS